VVGDSVVGVALGGGLGTAPTGAAVGLGGNVRVGLGASVTMLG